MIILLVLIIFSTVITAAVIANRMAFFYGEHTITTSTIERTKLPEGQCTYVDAWYEDDWGDWIDAAPQENIDDMIKAMRTFYENTGVQPYIWILGEEGAEIGSHDALEAAAIEKYDELFADTGHLLIAFSEYPNASGNYISGCYAGAAAETVMDAEAREILLDYIDYYYGIESLDEAELFENAVRDTGKRIMKVNLTTKQCFTILAAVAAAAIGLVLIFGFIMKRKEAEAAAKEAEAASNKAVLAKAEHDAKMEEEMQPVKCPNCGASLQVRRGATGKCDYCDTYVRLGLDGSVSIGKKEEIL